MLSRSALRIVPSVSSRVFSTTRHTQGTAKDVANNMIEAFPGNTPLTKTGIAGLATAIFATAISKELLILHNETLVAMCTTTVFYALYSNFRKPINEMIKDETKQLNAQMEKSNALRRVELEKTIQETKLITEMPTVLQEVYEIQKEMASMKATILEREAKAAVAEEIKNQLTFLYQLETRGKQSEQRLLLEHLRQSVLEQVKQPKFQTDYLQKCLEDLEALPAQKL